MGFTFSSKKVLFGFLFLSNFSRFLPSLLVSFNERFTEVSRSQPILNLIKFVSPTLSFCIRTSLYFYLSSTFINSFQVLFHSLYQLINVFELSKMFPFVKTFFVKVINHLLNFIRGLFWLNSIDITFLFSSQAKEFLQKNNF